MYSWGKGWFGVLGHGDDHMKIAPCLLESTKNMILKVSSGQMHTTALSLRRGGLSRRAVERADVEDTMRGAPPVYLGLPKHTAAAVTNWTNARCLKRTPAKGGGEEGEKEDVKEEPIVIEDEVTVASFGSSSPSALTPVASDTPKKEGGSQKVVFGEDPEGTQRAAWKEPVGEDGGIVEEKKNDSTPPRTPQKSAVANELSELTKMNAQLNEAMVASQAGSEKKKKKGRGTNRERTWRDLKPSEWYKTSKKLELFYKCEDAGFTCLSYHCARQCMNGSHNTRTRLLTRAVARQKNRAVVEKNIEDLREEGHTEGDVKR